MMRDDPLYLCGYYLAQLDALRAVIRGAGTFISTHDRRLIMAVLGMREPEAEPQLPAAPAVADDDEPL